jgi:hypothetical protein
MRGNSFSRFAGQLEIHAFINRYSYNVLKLGYQVSVVLNTNADEKIYYHRNTGIYYNLVFRARKTKASGVLYAA